MENLLPLFEEDEADLAEYAHGTWKNIPYELWPRMYAWACREKVVCTVDMMTPPLGWVYVTGYCTRTYTMGAVIKDDRLNDSVTLFVQWPLKGDGTERSLYFQYNKLIMAARMGF